MTDGELKQIEAKYKWADKCFIKSFLERRSKEKKIIDQTYDIYTLYPKYVEINDIYEDVEESKVVKNVKKASEFIKASLTSGAAICVANIVGWQMNIEALLAAAMVTVGGSVAFYQIDKGDLDVKDYSIKEQKRIFREFIDVCGEFENILSDYIFSVQEYVIEYNNDDKIDWSSIFAKILFENSDYIKSKKEEGVFDRDFNSYTVFNMYDQIFDRDEFNNFLLDNRDYYKEKYDAKVRKK